MNLRLVLLLIGLPSCPGESSVDDGLLERVQAFAGGHAILPCSFEAVDQEDSPAFEWSKEGPGSGVVFAYRQSRENYIDRNPEFDYRASGIMRELKDWNVSLRISGLKLDDSGIYKCMELKNNPSKKTTRVELLVVAEPNLSMVSAKNGLVTLMCGTGCWLPDKEPRMTFLDDDGNEISAIDTIREYDERGCYNMTMMVTLQRNTSRKVTCRVHEPEFGQTRDSCILIAGTDDPECSLALPIIITIVGTAVIFGFIFLLWKICVKSAETKKPALQHQKSDESIRSGASETRILLPQSNSTMKANNELNDTIENLKKQVADFESKIREKDGIICQLQSSSPISPVPCHQDKPVTGGIPFKLAPDVPKPLDQLSTPSTSRNPPKSVSLPQGLNQTLQTSFNNPTSGNPLQTSHTLLSLHHQDPKEKKQKYLKRSQSFNHDLLKSAPLRRPSLSHLSANRYDVLAELPEDVS
ncbi:uncharacterized protein LOC125015943 [Mugil cephalus]|uniref:uncharacterized protein LOC125015943 n=1 Tax=Mugil cephalus TaxID=48193 RepID=UPI001FB68201|nr:uncharacterized protein LOC125015943 [Mugil cephalus]